MAVVEGVCITVSIRIWELWVIYMHGERVGIYSFAPDMSWSALWNWISLDMQRPGQLYLWEAGRCGRCHIDITARAIGSKGHKSLQM
jgi:hypothetical protein